MTIRPCGEYPHASECTSLYGVEKGCSLAGQASIGHSLKNIPWMLLDLQRMLFLVFIVCELPLAVRLTLLNE